MDELLQRVAEIRGMPASLVERSAQARAEKEGISLEAVLQDWAGESAPSESAAEKSAASSQESEADPAAAQSEDDTADVPAEVTTDYLVQLAADAKRMPPKLILSSATARATHGNTTLEEVLANWAGADLEELKQQAGSTPQVVPSSGGTAERSDAGGTSEPASPPAAQSESEPAAAPVAAAVAGAITMDQLLDKVSEAKGMPPALAKRSAEARSKKTGEPVEAVLAEWAGEDFVLPSGGTAERSDAGGTSEPASQPSAEPEKPTEPEESEPADQPAAQPSGPEVIEASAPDAEAPTDELATTLRGGYPRWLAAAFLLIPLLAISYILVAPNGPDCGTAGQLLIDPITGETVNCDGSEYGTSEVNFLAQGAGLYTQCVACHAADGSGGAGPAFTGGAVLATFPSGSCSDHIEWVRIGTAGWPDPTYGANNKPVGGFGLMPAFATMTDEQLASVALYERVEFGGQTLEEAEIDCGLVTPEGEGEGDVAVEASES